MTFISEIKINDNGIKKIIINNKVAEILNIVFCTKIVSRLLDCLLYVYHKKKASRIEEMLMQQNIHLIPKWLPF